LGLVFRNTDLKNLQGTLAQIRWQWVALSVFLNLMSQYIRALRWRSLFAPMQYSPGTLNLFLSVVVLAFTNQVIPRGGEIARLGIINRYEKIPLTKLLGTALVERLTDLIILLMIFGTLVVLKFSLFMEILESPQISLQQVSIQNIAITIGIVSLLIIMGVIIIKRYKLISKFNHKLKQIRKEIKEGFWSLYHIKNKVLFFSQSILIYVLWLLMLYVLLFALPATSNLGFEAAIFTFGLASMAFLLPIQAGMGAWHFLVIQSLLLFSIDAETGKAFALMAHTATNLIWLPLGAIAFAILPLINNTKYSKQVKNAASS
jgi:uncharacterized protein (TIRG00374 family)